MTTIRKVRKDDMAGLKAILDSSELFPSEMLDGMISDYFENPDSTDIWFTQVIDEKPVALGYCAPEKFTEGTYNLYAIAVNKEIQGQGIGTAMMDFIEDLLRKRSHRILIVESSSGPAYKLTRAFYNKLGYTQEAVIREFWNTGEDKVVFWKKLGT